MSDQKRCPARDGRGPDFFLTPISPMGVTTTAPVLILRRKATYAVVCPKMAHVLTPALKNRAKLIGPNRTAQYGGFNAQTCC